MPQPSVKAIATFAAAAALIASYATQTAVAAPALSRSEAKLEAALQDLVEAPLGPPGVIAVVQRGGRRDVFRAGLANLDTGRRPGPRLFQRQASTAKAFSGAVALSLVASGKLSLDDTIGTRLAGQGFPAAWSQVTLGQLLQHTAGIPDFSADSEFRALLLADLRREFDSRKLWQYVADEPLDFPPGTEYRYSNTDNIIVALMTEAATGRRYERLLRSQVYRPLGLHDTSLPRGVGIPSPFFHGYDVTDAGAPEDITKLIGMSGVWASGGITSTPFDINSFARGYVGRALFPRSVQRQQMDWVRGTSEPPGPGANSAGLGIFRYRTRCGAVFGHTGNTPGYTQFLASSLNGRRSVAVAPNARMTQNENVAVWRVLRRAEAQAVCVALRG